MRFILVLILVTLNVGCGLTSSSQPNVIVLAVEGLGFDRVPCQNENLQNGFATLCQESIRFTHAYTNSTNSLANLTSVLTAQFPWEHGVRGQSQWLRPQRQTLGEFAIEEGYRTAFISSGLPMLSRTGLVQGFENFDDHVDLFSRPHFRPASKVVSAFFRWLNQENPKVFFSVLHFSDLLYPFVPSTTQEGDLRDLSVNSQLEEISEELRRLIDVLKEKNLWNSSYVALVGLSGGMDPSSLKSTQTQVTMMIKPPRLKRDQGTSWSVDLNVSLTDLGVSLYEVITKELPGLMEGKVSLSSVYSDPTPHWPQDRLILTEMYWSFENFGLDIVRSARRNHLLYIHQDPPLLYNTLTDRQEQISLPMTDSIYAQKFDSFREFLAMNEPRAQLVEIPEWFYLGVRGFQKGVWEEEGIKDSENPLQGWLLRYLLENGQWQKIQDAFPYDHLLQYIAGKKLHQPVDRDAIKDIPCGKAYLFSSLKSAENLRDNCDEDRLLQYVDWVHFKDTNEELYYENRFKRSFQFWWARLELGAMNYATNGSLGLPLTWPKPPDISELFLIYRERNPGIRRLTEGYITKAR